MNTRTLDERAEKMEENKTLSKSSIIRYRISSSILMILGYIIIMGCIYYSGVHLNIPIWIGASVGTFIGMFSKKPVRRNIRSERIYTLLFTIPFIIIICAIVLISSDEDISNKIIFSLIIIITIIFCEIIGNKILDKLWKENSK